MVIAGAVNQMNPLAEPFTLRRTNLPSSLFVEQSHFLTEIENQVLRREINPAVPRIACDGILPNIMPQLKSTLDVVLDSVKPSAALERMQQAGVLRTFSELDNLVRTSQDPLWHPEGTAWVHTMMVVDQASRLCRQLPIELSSTERQGVMWGALLHDIGKSLTTQTRISDRRIISPKHEERGVGPAREILGQLGVALDIARVALVIVEMHMAPPALYRELCKGELQPESYDRAAARLAKRIEPVRLEPLLIAAIADRLGRSTSQRYQDKIAFAIRLAEFLKIPIADSVDRN